MYEIKPLEWRTVENWSDGTVEAETIGGLLRCAPWESDSGETGVDWLYVRCGDDGKRQVVRGDGVTTMEQARAKCEQIHRDLVAAWLVPAGQVMDEPDEPGVYWIEGDVMPRDVDRNESGGWSYYYWPTNTLEPVVSRVAKVGPNPFAKGGA